MSKLSKNLSYVIKEIVIIIVGVLIALAINNFNENVKNKAFIEQTLMATENEISQSEESIKNVLQLHEVVLDSLSETYSYDSEESIGELLQRLGGIQSPTIKNIGLRFFVANKADLINYEIISMLSEIEIHSTTMDEKTKRLIDYVYENNTSTSEESKIKLAYFLANVIDSERTLLRFYAEFKTKIKSVWTNLIITSLAWLKKSLIHATYETPLFTIFFLSICISDSVKAKQKIKPKNKAFPTASIVLWGMANKIKIWPIKDMDADYVTA